MASQPPFGRVREHPRLHDPPTHSLLPSLSLSTVCMSVCLLPVPLSLPPSLSLTSPHSLSHPLQTSLPLSPEPPDLTYIPHVYDC